MMLEHQGEYESQWAAMGSIAAKIGCATETLRKDVVVKVRSVSFRGPGKRYLRVGASLQRHMDRFVDALPEADSP